MKNYSKFVVTQGSDERILAEFDESQLEQVKRKFVEARAKHSDVRVSFARIMFDDQTGSFEAAK